MAFVRAMGLRRVWIGLSVFRVSHPQVQVYKGKNNKSSDCEFPNHHHYTTKSTPQNPLSLLHPYRSARSKESHEHNAPAGPSRSRNRQSQSNPAVIGISRPDPKDR
ncbi:uncharacterized protein BDZ99DRAFT_258019 [Mytilinidion resinicola]|uniref:Uncharacterized protein n=1 Tax=Mytilinidion resinicola TaxID=574789 RepID=A0A6A6YYD3_9PEZI|nr:uncharacterized protein BDZ99DRAFT_258019 [Mytilinidion resinicola]KAF2813509.1 hypothetical protein BDZ99DRAFT_258019 [Mytilinidion resinicola]